MKITNARKESAESLLDACETIGIEVSTEKYAYIYVSVREWRTKSQYDSLENVQRSNIREQPQ
jgi:hypothetical protein